MVGLGIGVFFAGYTLLSYGWSQIHGANASLIELGWPGSYKGPSLDTGGTASPASTATATTKSTTPSIGTPSTSTAQQNRNTNQNHVAK